MKTWMKGTAALVAITAGVALAGCGPQSDGGGGKTETLKVFVFDNGPEWIAAYQAVADSFEAETGITVELETAGSSDYDGLIDTRLSGGEDGPDVFAVRPANIPSYVEGGYLADLSGEDWFTGLPEGAQNAPNTVQDGGHYAFPIAKNPNYVVYNKDLFAAAGVEVPTTLDELKEVSQTLLDNGTTPIAMSAQDSWWQFFILFHATAQHVLNVDPENGQEIMAGEQTFAGDEGWEQTLEIYKDLAPYYMPNPLGTSHDAAKAAFLQGQAAMFPAPWVLPDVRQTDLNVGAFVFPTTDDPEEPSMWGDFPVLLGVNPAGGDEEAAKQFSEFLLSDAAYPDLITALKYFPVKEGIDVSGVDPIFGEVQEAVEGRQFYPSPNDVWLPGVADVFIAEVQNLLAGNATVDEVLARTDQAVQDAQ
jgi:raffinose/stachyose/melibiose transport system substrate-binding protein